MSNQDYQTFPISADFTIHALPIARGFTLSDYDKERVELLWSQQTRAHPYTFNGEIFNVISMDKEKITGEFIEYKFYLAQRLDANLKELLNIRSLAVSGIAQTVDRVLIGKRSSQVATCPGKYEFVPSGGVDPHSLQSDGKINVYRQFELELFEEAAISVTEIKEIRLRNLVWDESLSTFELCADLFINYRILKEELKPNSEYESLNWLPKRDLKDFIEKNEEEFVPLTLFLAKHTK